MKHILLITLLFTIQINISVAQQIERKVTSQICECIDMKKLSKNVILKDSLNKCFGDAMAMGMLAGLREELKMDGEGITVEQIREIRDRLWRNLDKDCRAFRKVKIQDR